MTRQEYISKVNQIETTHPAPEGSSFTVAHKHYRNIIENWQKKLSDQDRKTIQAAERRFAHKMGS